MKVCFRLHFIATVISVGHAFIFKGKEFSERPDCRYKHIRTGTETFESLADSLIGCASQCSTMSGCLTFSFAQNGCRLHKGILDSTCGSYDTNIEARTFEKTCQNGGTPLNDTCICSGGYVGQNCERLATECGELLLYSSYPRTELTVQIQPTQSVSPITIVCDLDILNPVTNKARNYIQKHYQLGTTFYKLWDDYKNGFGDISQNEFWIGNEAIHHLTSAFHSTLVIEMASENWAGIWQQTYEGFRVQDEASEYRMTYASTSPYPGNSGMGDPLIHVNNTMFCTVDHNNNVVDPSVNCGSVRQSGFWLCDPGNKCGHGNPNGQLMKTGDGQILYVYHEVFWNTLNGGTTSPWFVQMWLEF